MSLVYTCSKCGFHNLFTIEGDNYDCRGCGYRSVETFSIGTIQQPLPKNRATFPKRVDRKHFPVATGVLDYFPDALVAIAEVSKIGNDQHNPGEPLHWARGKSMDQDDTLIRHFLQRGHRDTDGVRHSAKMAWRALALLQLEIEAEEITHDEADSRC